MKKEIEPIELFPIFQKLYPQQRISSDGKKVVCPFHSERTASLSFFRGTDGKQRFHCLGCGVKGDVLDLIQLSAKSEGEDLSVLQALQKLEVFTGKRLLSPKAQEAYQTRKLQQSQLQQVFRYFNAVLRQHPSARRLREWLIERGVPEATWENLPIGAYPPWEEIATWAKKEDISAQWLKEERLLIGSQRNGEKWLGALAFFYGQSYGEFSRIKLRPPYSSASEGRFLGREETDIGFFGLSHYLANNGDRPLIVEGEFDVLIPWARAGGKTLNIFCRSGSAGKAISAMMALRDLGLASPILLGDNDPAGVQWANELARNCRQVNLEASICSPPGYLLKEDPADMITRLGDIRAFEAAVLRGIRDPFAEEEESSPPLPAYASLEEGLGLDACPWLDKYIAFSKLWSPRGYEDFHEAVGIWILSTVAARRVSCELGKEVYPSLYILLIARTGVWAKTTTAKIGLALLRQAGLDWLLSSAESTPQGFLLDLCGRLPGDYGDLTDDIRERARMQATLPGRRGWYYEEFGQHLAAMLREGGFMADFRGILRKFDDHPPAHEYSTASRGRERISKPYLSLLGSLTPTDFCEIGKKGVDLWNDGYLARFGLVAAPMENKREKNRFPAEKRIIPLDLLSPLSLWNQQLGIPNVYISPVLDGKGRETGRYRVESEAESEENLIITDEVIEAFNCYDEALHEISGANQRTSIDGHYHRFSEKALRIALLLASFARSPIIMPKHWARAQEITEKWRSCLHRLVGHLEEKICSSRAEKIEEKILALGSKIGNPSVRDLKQRIRGATTMDVQTCLDSLVRAGLVERIVARGQRGPETLRYLFGDAPGSEPAPGSIRGPGQAPPNKGGFLQ